MPQFPLVVPQFPLATAGPLPGPVPPRPPGASAPRRAPAQLRRRGMPGLAPPQPWRRGPLPAAPRISPDCPSSPRPDVLALLPPAGSGPPPARRGGAGTDTARRRPSSRLDGGWGRGISVRLPRAPQCHPSRAATTQTRWGAEPGRGFVFGGCWSICGMLEHFGGDAGVFGVRVMAHYWELLEHLGRCWNL